MQMPEETRADTFRSESYRGHTIAILSHGKGWLAYLDHVLQHNLLFVTADAAAIWLRSQVDAAAPSGPGDLALGEGQAARAV